MTNWSLVEKFNPTVVLFPNELVCARLERGVDGRYPDNTVIGGDWYGHGHGHRPQCRI